MAQREHSGLLEGVTSMLGAIGLANENEEVLLDHPDRQSQLGAGAFLSVSQQSVAPQVTGRVQGQRTQAALDKPASLVTQSERFFIVDSGHWNESDLEFHEISRVNVPWCFMNKKMSVYGNLGFHTMMRAGFEFQIMMNPTSFQQGAILLVAMPYYACHNNNGQNEIKMSFRALMTLPHCLLNCNVNNSGAIRIPWLHTRNLMRIHTNPRAVWTLGLYVWSRLRVGSGTSTHVDFRILGRVVDLELHGLRPYTEAPNMNVTVLPGAGALNTANKVGTIPTQDLSLGPESFPLDETMGGGLRVTDLDKQMQTPCWLARVQMTTTESQGHLLWQCPVQPENPSLTFQSVKHLTNLAALSNMFRYWRGDIMYKFQIMCTRYHSGRIMISYVPGTTQVLSFEDHLSSSILMFDINGVSSTATVRIPFVSDTMYRSTDDPTGLLTLWIVNGLSSPDNVSHTVDIVATQSAHPNFQFFAPTWVFRAQMMDGGDVVDKPVAEVTIGADDTDRSASIQPDTEVINAATVVEDPRMLISKTGTFPEIRGGPATHSAKHTSIAELMGRARVCQAFNKAVGAWSESVQLRFDSPSGPLRMILRMGALLRGSMRVIVTIDTEVSNASATESLTRIAFFPHPMPNGTISDEVMASVGFVQIVTSETAAVKIKVPWYTTLSAVNLWGGPDVTFGWLHFTGFAMRALRCRIHVAFGDDTEIIFPMPVQIQEGINMRVTRHSHRQMVPPDSDDDASSDEDEHVSEKEPTATEASYSLVDDDFNDDPPELEDLKPQGGDEFVPQRAEELFMTGDLIKRPINAFCDHYAVYIGGNTVVHLVPKNDEDWVWAFQKNGEIKMEPLGDKKWTFVAHSPEPEITFRAALSRLGDHEYSLMFQNCEHFARTQCMVPVVSQSEKATQVVVAVGATMAAGATLVADWVPHAGTFKKYMGKVVTKSIDDSKLSQAATTTLESTASEVKETASSMRDVMSAIKKVLDPRKLFPGRVKQKIIKWGSKILNFVLDCLSLTCEVIALVRSQDSDVRALIGTALGARLASSLIKFMTNVYIATKMSSDFESQGGFGPDLVNDDMGKILCGIVDSCWKRNCGEEFLPQGGFITILKDFSAVTMALKSGTYFIKFLGLLLVKFRHWMSPKTAAAVRYKICKKMPEKMRELNVRITKLSAKPTVTGRQKEAVCAEARGINNEIVTLLEATAEAETDNARDITRSLMAAQCRVAKIIMDNQQGVAENAFRPEPVVMYLCGRPGGGKSVTAMAAAAKICRDNGIDLDTGVYTRVSGGDYWDGYCGQQVMIVDDMGQNTDGEDWKDFCQIVSVAPYRVNMACLSEKGAVFRTPYIIITTNTIVPKPNTVSDHGALLRRLTLSLMVSPVKGCSEGGKLDLDKARDKGLLKSLKCCDYTLMCFHPTKSGGLEYTTDQTYTFDQVMAAFMRKQARKSAIHNQFMQMITADIFDPQGGEDEIAADPAPDSDFQSMEDEEGEEMMELLSLGGDYESNRKRRSPGWEPMKTFFHEVTLTEEDDLCAPYDYREYQHIQFREELCIPGKPTVPPEDVKKFRRTLCVIMCVTAVVGVLGMVGAVAGIVSHHKMKKAKSERGYAGPHKVDQLKLRVVSDINQESAPQSHVEVAMVIKKATYQIGVEDAEGKRKLTGYCVFIKGTTFMAVKHCLLNHEKGGIILLDGDEPTLFKYGSYSVVDLRGDLVFVTLPEKTIPQKRDITGLFVEEAALQRAMQGYAVAHLPDEATGVFPFTNLQMVPNFEYPSPDGTKKVVVPSAVKGMGCGRPGLCGAVWVSTVVSTGCKGLGIHVAGSSSHSACQIVTYEELTAAMSMCAQSRIIAITRAASVIASGGRTRISKSPFHQYIAHNKEPSCLGEWDPRALNDPHVQILMKHKQDACPEPPDWYRMRDLLGQFGQKLHSISTDRGNPIMLSMDEAIDGNGALEGIDMKTSAGMPWSQDPDPRKRKKAYIRDLEEFRLKVYEIVHYCTDIYGPSTPPELVYTTFAKDELLGKERVAMGRTRFVSAAPFHFTTAARILFGTLVSRIHMMDPSTPESMGVAVGIDPETKWSQLATCRPGWKILAVDYSNFDGTLQKWVIETACEVLAILAGYPPDTGRRFGQLIHTSKQQCGDIIYHVDGALPSGCPFTSVIGSLCNLAMSVHVMAAMTGQHPGSFWTWAHIATYGDDALLWVHPDIEMQVRPEEFARRMHTTFRAVATDALDKSKPPQLRPLSQCTFLKRGFRMCAESCYLYHPTMDVETIWSMLAWRRQGADLADLVLVAANFMFHHGRDSYSEFVTEITKLMHFVDIDMRAKCVVALRPYEQWHEMWVKHQ